MLVIILFALRAGTGCRLSEASLAIGRLYLCPFVGRRAASLAGELDLQLRTIYCKFPNFIRQLDPFEQQANLLAGRREVPTDGKEAESLVASGS